MQRAMSGGHDVSDEVIHFNFTEGKLRIKENLHLFENLTFIDGNANYGRIIAMHISKNQSHFVEDNPPKWFIDNFSDAFDKL